MKNKKVTYKNAPQESVQGKHLTMMHKKDNYNQTVIKKMAVTSGCLNLIIRHQNITRCSTGNCNSVIQ